VRRGGPSRLFGSRFSLWSIVDLTPISAAQGRYDSMLWMRDLKEGAAYLPE
jgi:hypothetical protein